jgi:hypothetical protein
MHDKKFDEHIKAMMRDHEVPLNPEHWQMFEEQMDMVGGEETSFLNDDLINQLKNYQANPIPGDWEVMAGLLDQADQHFDKNIKDSVDSYEVPYDQKTWPILEKKLTYAEIRRRKLFVAKVLEVATVLLFLFTLYNFYPEIKTKVFKSDQEHHTISVDKSLFTHADETDQNSSLETAQLVSTGQSSIKVETSGQKPSTQKSSVNINSSLQSKSEINQSFAYDQRLFDENESNEKRNEHTSVQHSRGLSQANAILIEQVSQTVTQQGLPFNEAISTVNVVNDSNIETARLFTYAPKPIDALLGALHVPLFHNSVHHKLYGQFVANTKRKVQTRVGIHAGADVNILHFPADNFFSAGNRVSFKAQDLPALGYGGGISYGRYGQRFGIETGIHYSNKSFKPGRQLLIGESFENSKVDFQAVEIDLVSIPLSLSYQVKPTGTFRFYVVGGFDLNIIAQAHYDLNIKNNYPLPLSITQSASALALNREAHRVKEHILDGATFNGKSYVTAHAGFGIEKYLNPDLSIFMQPSYLYQVPINRFSNNGGKHFKTLNIRIGARMPLE